MLPEARSIWFLGLELQVLVSHLTQVLEPGSLRAVPHAHARAPLQPVSLPSPDSLELGFLTCRQAPGIQWSRPPSHSMKLQALWALGSEPRPSACMAGTLVKRPAPVSLFLFSSLLLAHSLAFNFQFLSKC